MHSIAVSDLVAARKEAMTSASSLPMPHGMFQICYFYPSMLKLNFYQVFMDTGLRIDMNIAVN